MLLKDHQRCQLLSPAARRDPRAGATHGDVEPKSSPVDATRLEARPAHVNEGLTNKSTYHPVPPPQGT